MTSTRPHRAASNLSKVPYLPGLDGMRALAVAAVLVYHANPTWLPGGFLGVEVFFVISGYLITLLLMAERERTGTVRIGAFWMRRARRLLPALFLMLFLLITYTWMFRAEELGKLRGDVIAALFYVSNWYQIWVGQGYSATGDFAPLRHLWSLAVEEQFYLLWPVAMLFLLRRNGTRNLALTARWLVVAAIAVTVLTALVYHPGRIGDCSVNPEAYWTIGDRCISKADTLYLSTITRSSGLLLGAAFAMLWRPMAIMRGPLRNAGRLLDLIALAGLGFLCLFVWTIHFVTPAGADPWLFRGGFLWTALATLMMIAAVTHSRTITAKVLGNPVFLYVGTRSYGLYLFSWPIYQIIREVAGNVLSFREFVVALILTMIITELSYRFIEMPVRRRQVAAWWESLRVRRDPVPRQIAAVTVVATLLVLAFGVLRLGLADVEQNEIAAALDAGQENVTSLDELLGTGGDEGAAGADPPPSATTVPAVADTAVAAATTTSTTTTTTTTTLPKEPVDYLAIGDSVMLGAAGVLSNRGYTVNAEVSRQMVDVVPVMEQLADADLFGDPVVIHLGTNGPFTKETLDAFLAPLSSVPNVIMLNIRAERPWTASNNALLQERDRPGDNIILIDWQGLSQGCTGNCFSADGIHLSADGQRFYADVIGDVTGR
ncbi:acyltransferase family protein [Ilumatobacter sp.]|uniref:acyltransferase family protein n=1 Tax=Ilumatobacter sp. TaxID=1967498 RepID=UPI003AF62A6B